MRKAFASSGPILLNYATISEQELSNKDIDLNSDQVKK